MTADHHPTPDPAVAQAEDRFLARFWLYASRPEHAGDCLRAAGTMRGGEFAAPGRAACWAVLAARCGAGKPLDLRDPETRGEMRAAAGDIADAIWILADAERTGPEGHKLAVYARPVRQAARARYQSAKWADVAADLAGRQSAGEDPATLLKLGESHAVRLLSFYSKHGDRPSRTPHEIVAAELAGMDAKEPPGIPWPWPKLQRSLGSPIRKGYLIGVTGVPGGGKSTFLANLLGRLVMADRPVIAVITEDADEWLRRMWCALADVPQSIGEPQAWDSDDPHLVAGLVDEWGWAKPERWDLDAIALEMGISGPSDLSRPHLARAMVAARLAKYRRAYEQVVRQFDSERWELIEQQHGLSMDDVTARAKAIRRKWPGEQVTVGIDHAHNLEYPDGKTELHIGAGCQRLKAALTADDEGGMAAITLFQPVQSALRDRAAGRRPILMGEVGGQAARHLNIHFSVYRPFVATASAEITPWGAPACEKRDGLPVVAKSQVEQEDGTHECDEFVFGFADKRRRAGLRTAKVTKGFVLNISAPSGKIYELDRWHSPAP